MKFMEVRCSFKSLRIYVFEKHIYFTGVCIENVQNIESDLSMSPSERCKFLPRDSAARSVNSGL